jgi:hypothetical protein
MSTFTNRWPLVNDNFVSPEVSNLGGQRMLFSAHRSMRAGLSTAVLPVPGCQVVCGVRGSRSWVCFKLWV